MNHLTLILAFLPVLALAGPIDPIAKPDLVFEEQGGIVAFEAEHFFKQELTGKRAWYLTSKNSTPDITPDGDPSFVAGASGGAYLEILPDTRRSHGDKLITGENFMNEPGKMAVLSYKVHFNTPGKYWIWARAYSTTTEDNGLHFGIDGTWPDSAQRWQTVVKRRWHWESKQRTQKVHTGVRGILTLDVDKPGEHIIHVSMREDGIELDKILLANRKDYLPQGLGPDPVVKAGTLPKPFPFVKESAAAQAEPVLANSGVVNPVFSIRIVATSFEAGAEYYIDQGKWLAINPEHHKSAEASTVFRMPAGRYDIRLEAVGENDGGSSYKVSIGSVGIGTHTAPLASKTYEEGPRFWKTWKNVEVPVDAVIKVRSTIASADGQEFSRARWSGLMFTPADEATRKAFNKYAASHKPAPGPKVADSAPAKRPTSPALHGSRKPDGDGQVMITGELKQWHKVTLNLDGPFAHEKDNSPNPFTDRAFNVTFTHESGDPEYVVPGYFAADGKAANSSAESGTVWKAHLSPDKPGKWTYTISFTTGKDAALDGGGAAVAPYDGLTGTFDVGATDKTGRDFRAHGRLEYVGRHFLQFQGSKRFFLKAGADAPETLLGYRDFDGTRANNPGKVPLKTFAPHLRDWKDGDPAWKNGKGKGLIGALNYLSSTGANAFSFLPYNAGGDGDNVWPFIARNDKFHYDCSKLDQWGIVFDHATAKGLYLHFKMQETEMDDNRKGHNKGTGLVPTSLDGGRLGPERKLYCRELIARFGHALALNWNLGEENTQTTAEIKDMIGYIHQVDPYDHHVVLHTFPNQQDKQYGPLLGYKGMTGLSVQNSNVKDCHHQVVKWVRESAKAGHPWVVAFDEPGDATYGMPPDDDYPGMAKLRKGKDANKIPTVDDVRKYTLWGTFMAGGTGVEYYFGYKLPQNDLLCEDWRSRARSWEYCRIALEFLGKAPIQDMTNRNDLIGNSRNDNSKYCLANDGDLHLVYLPTGGSTDIKLPAGNFLVRWFNPRNGVLKKPVRLEGNTIMAPDNEDWLAIITKQK